MSLAIVRSEVNRFLAASEPKVLALKGHWGTGKTYTWKKLVREYAREKTLPTEKYTYVSLFGVDSLKNLKFLLFQQAVANSEIGSEASIASFRENAAGLAQTLARKGFTFFTKLPWLRNISNELRSLAFLSIRKYLICIDDLERKGDGLSVKDVLGLISQLKEEKGCKIVLILNDDGLESDDQAQFLRNREKVIDVELRFEPTAGECASLALDLDNEVDSRIAECVASLGITNIRLIFRIKSLIQLLLPVISATGSEVEALHKAIHVVALLAWCHFSSDDI